MKVLLAEHTWQEVEELLKSDPVVVIPTGSNEQHGPHLPLMVDSLLASSVAELAAREAFQNGVPTLVTPPVWSGYSPHHMDFAGSITLSAATFMAVLTDVARSLHHHGFRRILFLNGHGGNSNLMRSAVQSLRFEHGVSALAANYWDLAVDRINAWRESPLGGINHACEFETSMMLALRKDSVRRDLIKDHVLEPSRYSSPDLTLGGPVSTATSFASLTSSGTLGAPSLATEERGEKILAEVVGAVAAFLVNFATVEPATNGDWVV